MGLNKKLNLKLKNKIHLIKEWLVNKDNTFIELHFERCDFSSFAEVKKMLDDSKLFDCKNVSVHQIGLPILNIMEVK